MRNLKRIEKDFFKELLSITPFENILLIAEIDNKLKYFNDQIIGLFDTVAFERMLKRKKNSLWNYQSLRKQGISRSLRFIYKFRRTMEKAKKIKYILQTENENAR